MWSDVLFSFTAGLFLLMAVAALVSLRRATRLPGLDTPGAYAGPGRSNPNPPRCSAVVAARDEAARIEGTVRGLLAQRDVDLDVIVVDDRSVDGTGDIVKRVGSEDPRVRLIRVDVLPDAWLGKCHACHLGAASASGDWLLFTDADCWMKPDVVARALRMAERDAADHVTLTPGVTPQTLAAHAWHIALMTRLASWIAAVNRDRPGAYLGMGAFNLVRASAYRDCGGYEALRLTVVDDVKLGLLLQRAGKRTRAFLGGDDVTCHWGTTAPAMLRIMEKNYFAAIDYRLAPVAAGAAVFATLFGAALVGPWTGTLAGAAAGLAPWTLILPGAIVARRLRWPLAGAVLAPPFYLVLMYAVVHSAVVTLRQGGIRWRETFYSLDTLRRGNVGRTPVARRPHQD